MPIPTLPPADPNKADPPDGWGTASLALGLLALLALPLVLLSPILAIFAVVCGMVSVAVAGERGASRVPGWVGVALGITAGGVAIALLVSGRWLIMSGG